MTSPLTLPIARLRAAGCKVSTAIGHDPITTGAHPRARSRWFYGVTIPDEALRGRSLEDALWRTNHSWSTSYGEAISYRNYHTGVHIVQLITPEDPEIRTAAQLRAVRKHYERQVATLLDRIATAVTQEA